MTSVKRRLPTSFQEVAKWLVYVALMHCNRRDLSSRPTAEKETEAEEHRVGVFVYFTNL